MPTLVYHAGALGDFITALPAIDAWRRRHPRDPVTYLGPGAHGALGLHFRYFEEAWDVDRADCAPLFAPEPDNRALGRLSRFGAALLFAGDESPIIANCGRAGVPAILHQPPFPPGGIHIVDYHLSLFPESLATGGDTPVAAPRLLLDVEEGPRSATAVIHPGSGSALKNWPADRFVAVADALHARGVPVRWLQGPADGDPPGAIPDAWIRRMPALVDLAHDLSHSRLFVGNDSGVAHLAAAAGCPTVAIFGPSDAMVWAPRGPHVRVVTGPCPCAGPCHRNSTRAPCLERTCLTSITVDRVLSAIFDLLDMPNPRAR